MKIQCIDRNIEQVLNSGVYVIPRFQRAFSWDKYNVEELWNDSVKNPINEYFVGSFVTYEMGRGTYGVVDGQQRLTTITIALCIIRNKYQEYGFDSAAKGIHQLIQRSNIENKSLYVLHTETSYPYFQLKIQSFHKDDEIVVLGDEEKSIKSAYEVILNKVDESLVALDYINADDAKKKKIIKKELDRIRDRFLKLNVISITLQNQDDAYAIFETMNTRGKDLTSADLIKNHILRLMPARAGGLVDRAKDHWREIQENLRANNDSVRLKTFLHHYWVSLYPFTTEKSLFKEFRSNVNRVNVGDFLSSLRLNSKLYSGIESPDGLKKWNPQTIDIRDSIYSISNILNIQIANPLLLSTLRLYDDNSKIRSAQVREICSLIENYHFIYTTISGLPSSGGVTQMYAVHARNLSNCRNTGEVGEEIVKFREKIKTKIPNKIGFVSNFKNLSFEDFRRKEVLKYVLWKINNHLNPAVAFRKEEATFEHISSQDKKLKNMHSIGNLLLVPDLFNSRDLSNKSFEEKKNALKEGGFKMDNIILGHSEWNEQAIEDRNNFLADLAYDVIWKI